MSTNDIDLPVAPPPAEGELLSDGGIGSLLVPERLQIWAWVLAYTAFMGSVTVFRYHLWLANGWDLGLYQQALWAIWHHGPLAVSSYTGQSIFARAGSLALILFAPIYAVGGVGLLLVAQAFCLGLGYLFVRRIAEFLGVHPSVAHLLALIYLIFPTVIGVNLTDFHPDVLAVPVIFGIIWVGLRDRWIWAVVLALVATLVRDTASLPVLALGAVLVFSGHPRSGLAVMVAAALAYVLDARILLPLLTHGGVAQLVPGLGAASVPGLLARAAGVIRTYQYLGVLILPMVPLAALGWRRVLNPWWIPGLLVAGLNILIGTPASTDPFDQFTVTVVPFLSMGAIVSVSSLSGRMPRVRRQLAMVLPLILLLVVLYHEKHVDFGQSAPNLAQVEAAALLVPPGAALVTQNFVAPHLADRANEVVPSPGYHPSMPIGTYVLIDSAYSTGSTPKPLLAQVEREAKKNGKIAFDQAGVELLRTTKPIRL